MDEVQALDKNWLEGIDESFDEAREGAKPNCEFFWLGVDRDDRLAILGTAGFAEVPISVFSCFEDYSAAMREIIELPRSSGLGECDPRRPWDEREFARRGLYFFDAENVGHSTSNYVRQAIPRSPSSFKSLSDETQIYIGRQRVSAGFAEHAVIDIQSDFPRRT